MWIFSSTTFKRRRTTRSTSWNCPKGRWTSAERLSTFRLVSIFAIENLSSRRWTTIPAPLVSYSVHEGKHFLFQLWVDYFLSWFTMGPVWSSSPATKVLHVFANHWFPRNKLRYYVKNYNPMRCKDSNSQCLNYLSPPVTNTLLGC